MLKLQNPPATETLLQKIWNNIVLKNYANLNVNLLAFRGSGKLAELKYVIDNSHLFPNYNPHHIYSLLDLSLFSLSNDTAFRESLVFVQNHYGKKLSSGYLNYLQELLSKTEIKISEYLQWLNFTTRDQQLKITIILDNASQLYSGNIDSKELVESIYSIKKSYPMSISFLFISDVEFDESAVEKLQRLSSIFIENLVYGKDLLFDEKSALCLIRNQEEWNSYKFSELFIDLVKNLSFGDPSVLRIITNKAFNDKEFENNFIKASNVEKKYDIVGNELLDTRYKRIIAGLLPPSISVLKSGFNSPTHFLINTGLLLKEPKDKFVPVNPLFEVFIKRNKDLLTPGEKAAGKMIGSIKQILSGQELLVFNILEANEGKVVDRESIALTIWGKGWEDRYSDWAIDKLVSNIREKFEKNRYPKTIKAIKGKGIMLL